ncbi:MAG: DUF6569 family protein [Vulcanimicrobiota bacterium]
MPPALHKALKKSRKGKTTVAQLLRGCEAGPMQSAGIMQIIPLLSDIEDRGIISPVNARFRTEAYGTMIFENPSSSIMLIPCHTGYMVKQSAQDHAMGHAALVGSESTVSFDTAMCIQQTQPGFIAPGNYDMMILPFPLREKALQARREKKFNKIWNDILDFNRELGIDRSQAHLEYFFTSFERELNQFVAEFEWIPRQVGAVILVEGNVAGIERSPSAEYFQSVWEPLIRECYGSLALKAARKGEAAIPSSRVSLNLDSIRSFNDLRKALADAEEKEAEIARRTIRELMDEPFYYEEEEKLEKYTMETVGNSQFVGQLVRDGDRVCYLSLITSDEWRKKKEWETAKPFVI